MTTDLTFFTNEQDAALLDRFTATLRDVQFFDVLVGYFCTCGFEPLRDLHGQGATGRAMGTRVERAGV